MAKAFLILSFVLATFGCVAVESNLLSEAKILIKKRDFAGAISNLNEVIEHDPNNIEAYWTRSEAFVHVQDANDALADAAEVIRLDPKNAHTYFYRAVLLVGSGQSNKALQDLNEAIRLKPEFFAAFAARGSIYCDAGDFTLAIADETKAMQLDPMASSPYYTRGKTYNLMEQYDKAMPDLDKAISLNSLHPASYTERANAESKLARYDEAIADCTKAISLLTEVKPGLPAARPDWRNYFFRGRAYAFTHEYEKAIQDFDKLIQLQPNNAPTYFNKGRALELLGEYKQAISTCEIGVLLSPKDAHGHNNLAWLLATCPDAELRNGPRALAEAKKANDLTDWKEPYNLGTVAAAYAETGDFENAIKWQKKAIEIGFPKSELAEEKAYLKLYEAKTPYHAPGKNL